MTCVRPTRPADDTVSDSEGKDVLRKRRQASNRFLVKMMELAEMVAVVFHQNFRFAKPSVMEPAQRGPTTYPVGHADGRGLAEPGRQRRTNRLRRR